MAKVRLWNKDLKMPRFLLVTFAIVTLHHSVLDAQQIRVTKKPPACPADTEPVYDSWWISAALRDDTAPTMLGTRVNSLARAQAYAQSWLANNHAAAPSGAWTRIKFIEIEGEASCRPKAGPALPSLQDLTASQVMEVAQDSLKAKLALDQVLQKVTDPADALAAGLAKALEPGTLSSVLSGYASEAANAYERAKELKQQLLSRQVKATEDSLAAVNRLIDDYNSKRDLLSTESAGKFNALPRMTRVTPGMVSDAGRFVTAQETREELQREKTALEQEEAALDREYSDLGTLGSDVDGSLAIHRWIARKSRGPGPFRARPPGDVVIDGVFLGFRKHDTYEAARAFAGERGLVLDADGNRLDAPPTVEVTAEDVGRSALSHQTLEESLRNRTSAYRERLARYEARLKRYHEQLAQYRRDIQALESLAWKRPVLTPRNPRAVR